MSQTDWSALARCETCGAECGPQDGWTEQDAEREAAELFDGVMDAPEDERVVLCDDCWQQFMVWMRDTYGSPPWPHLKEPSDD